MKHIYIVQDEDGNLIAFGNRRAAEHFVRIHPETLDNDIQTAPYYENAAAYERENEE
jgi:hypothetical protein|nr:MAG TPA: hypothetical protein [Caudoviricetes sp.]